MNGLFRSAIAAAVGVLLAGCQPSGVGKVSGHVTLDGKPLPGAVVMFQPESGRPSYGESDSEGRYQLNYTPGVRGAVVGKHAVQIRTGREDVDFKTGKITKTPERLPPRFHDRTELNSEVKAGRNQISFELSSK